ncbi:dienelactone hydrolase family protein [Paracoccus suum]|uniref:Dienelactone hydrolase family protein n=1 Tax=Paracoccus suum TaxID=2259340 RepID=A0A344PHC1_9RHOB|nr:dienelactone hydrolase family protein [Paracoccus suum]AXC48776.1 dienelactone hydrolase family protein [Paracoccus suum]
MKAVLTMTMIAAAGLPAATAAGEAVTYSAEGREFEGYLAKADNPKGAVVLIHDWDGLNEYEKSRADQLAALGYSTFAVDIYGKGVRPTTMEGNKAETAKLYGDRPMMVKLLEASVAEAQKQGLKSAVVIGYCFGGAAALELAAAQPEGVVGYGTFHAGLGQLKDTDFAAAKAPVRLWHGGADASAPLTALAVVGDKLNAAGTPWRATIYGGARHTFTVPGTKDYVEADDKDSWAQFQAFLAEVFK